MELFIIVIALLVGGVFGYFNWIPPSLKFVTRLFTSLGLIVLLMTMGFQLGADEELLKELQVMGWQALILALGGIGGSLLFIFWMTLHKKSKAKDDKQPRGGGQGGGRLLTLIILLVLCLGIVTGWLWPDSFLLPFAENITMYALAILLLGVGLDIGENRDLFTRLKGYSLLVFLIPLLIAFGTIAGTVLMGIILGFTGAESAAIGAGFGWYSLSAIILTNIHSIELGTLAFLTNIIRELLAILSLPLIARYLGQVASIAPGGATTMDVTLPLVQRCAGDDVVIPAFYSGVILSALVPILVPFFISLG